LLPAVDWFLSALIVLVAALIAYRLGGRRARKAASELTNLNEISRQLLRSQLSVDGLCELVYLQAGQMIPTTLFQLGLFEGDAYHVKVWVKNSEHQPEAVFPEGGQKGIVGWVRNTAKPLLVHDFEAEKATLPAFPEHDLEVPPKSGVFVPLIAGTSTIGVIAIQSFQVGRFTLEHLRLLTALANQAAWAIRNAQLFERANHRAEQLRLIGQVTAQTSAVQPLPDLFKQIVTLAQEKLGYYCVSIFVYDEDECELYMGATTSERFASLNLHIEPGRGLIGWAAENSKYAFAENVAEDTRYRKLSVLPETRSEIALPLKVEDRVLGVLDVQSDKLGTFQEEDVYLLETLAAQVAMAIEQAQAYAVERRLRQRLEALMQVTQAVVSVLDLNDLLDEVVDLISDTFGYERVHIFLRLGNTLVFRAGAGPHSVRWLVEELSYTIDEAGLIPKAARTGEAELIPDVTASPDYVAGPSLEDTQSEMVIPIKMGRNVMGVIDLQSEEENAFSQEDLSLMRALADSVAVAIRNAMLYVTERRRRKLADTLREISAVLVSDLDLDRVLADILEGLSRVITVDTAAILLVEMGADALTVAATTGPVELADIVGRELPLNTLITEDGGGLEEAVTRVYHDLLDAPEGHSCITAPLTAGGHVIGYLIVDNHRPDHYSADDMEIVMAFANQAAIALNNARLYTAQQSEAWVTTALLQVAEAVHAQVEVEQALETVAHLTTLLAGVGQCIVLRWEPDIDCYFVSAAYGVDAERLGEFAAEGFPAEKYPYLELLTVADQVIGAGEGHQLPIPEPLQSLMETSSVLGFPLRAKQATVGVLLVDDPRRGKPLDPRLLNILTGIAHQAATSLETAVLQKSVTERERLEQELDVARSIQASFIPLSPPQAPGWEIATYWRAARQVGGDFYDFIPLRDGQWGLAIADVADKGIPAALFMAMCRTLLRASAINRTSPSATLQRLNQLLFNDSRSDLFVTAFYSVWNPETGEVTYASAGHNPPLLLRADGSIVELQSKGIALSVVPDARIAEHKVTMQPGDMLVAYTDGVTEAMQADYTEWTMDRFKQAILKHHGETSQEMMQGILAAIDTFVAGAPQSDDLTMWILKREQRTL
jgi:phosphoserine phosphatase RsbU/P